MAAFCMAAPLLVIGFAVGVVMNLVQVATSLQDNAFSTFPRLAAFLVGFSILMPWMLKHWISYTVGICSAKSPSMGTEFQLDLGTAVCLPIGAGARLRRVRLRAASRNQGRTRSRARGALPWA